MNYAEESLARTKAELAALSPIPLNTVPMVGLILGPRPASEGLSDPKIPPTERRHPFEVFIIGYTDSNYTTARCLVYAGTVLEDEEDITSRVVVDDTDAVWTLTDEDWLYIKATFDGDGVITDLGLHKAGVAGWTGYPSLTPDASTWIQPVAHVRDIRKGQSGGTTVDSGEWSQIESGLFISQKTNTHLVKVQACIGGNLRWKLIPGVGGKD